MAVSYITGTSFLLSNKKEGKPMNFLERNKNEAEINANEIVLMMPDRQ